MIALEVEGRVRIRVGSGIYVSEPADAAPALATAVIEIFPVSLALGGKNAPFLVLVGYLIIHFFEHTVTPHFHFGEEVHKDEFVQIHKGYSVLLGLIIHTFFDGIAIASGFIVSNWLGWIISWLFSCTTSRKDLRWRQ